MQKLARVSCELPKGVAVKLNDRLLSGAFSAANEMVDRAWADFFRTTSVRATSKAEASYPLALELEVPAGLELEVAEALAKMARELRGIE